MKTKIKNAIRIDIKGRSRLVKYKKCIICGNDFLARIEKNREQNFCSKKCFFMYKPKSKEIECYTCHKKIIKNICHINRSKKNYCSKECFNNNPDHKKRYKDKEGYVLIKMSEHPFSNNKGYIREHRIVMENKIGRILDKKEIIHHINGIKDDNRIENLQLVSLNNHLGKIICPHCNRSFYIK